MAFALIGIGLLLFMAAYHNNVALLGSQLSADLTGNRGFIIWVVALFLFGAVGYVPALKNVSRAFLVLVLVVIFLANKGFFENFTKAIGVAQGGNASTGAAVPATPATPATPAVPVGG